MARALPISDTPDAIQDPQPGEWQALRGELVALLDQVEGRYARPEHTDPAMEGLAQRVRNLRDQVGDTPEPVVRRREALRTVKRAVDRFSDRDETDDLEDGNPLQNAIAEIRSRQMSGSAAALGRRPVDMPEFRELTSLVGGLSGRLERLEGELKSQRANNGSVREVASQVEQLTHVVELLAGAVGETGQVKRLEAQIAALARMIGDAPAVDLSTVNRRLDDVSATVGKLAELQAEQMEREIIREDRLENQPDAGETLAPAMTAIESSVRNVYDRIDAIEKNVALSSGDFERLTSEMAAFTQAMRDGEAVPAQLMGKVDALASRIGSFETANGDVVGLKQDISALREAVMSGMEPRFTRIESQISALSQKVGAPAPDKDQIESQLKLLMARMDETGAQLDGLAKLYSAPEQAAPDMSALATMVAEKTSQAVAKANAAMPAPVMNVATIDVFEKRMTALLNTAGRDTAERLTRLEAALTQRQPLPPRQETPAAAVTLPPEPVRAAKPGNAALDDMLQALDRRSGDSAPRSDTMPANPADDAPLTDPGFGNPGPVRRALDAKNGPRLPGLQQPPAAAAEPAKPAFDASSVERPPRPRSSFAETGADPFAPEPERAGAQVQPEVPLSQTSTSTFVAAARRAQRAKQESGASTADTNSLIGKALARVMPGKPNADTVIAEPALAPAETKTAKPVKEPKAPKPPKAPREAKAAPEPVLDENGEIVDQASFLTRYRRPLLLAALLVAVSMLALNLVMQRSAPANGAATPTNQSPTEAPAVDPVPAPASDAPAVPKTDGDLSLVLPSSGDVIDTLAVGSINPLGPMGFSKSPNAEPMPPALDGEAMDGDIAPLDVPAGKAVVPATDDGPEAVATAPATFDLPPEAIGPLELRQAAANGDARAQFEIGAIYTEGRAVPQDYKQAATWYERSAAQGFVPAEYRLGNLYESGNGVDKDLDVAKLWYQRGAEAGNRMAMHNLAALYASGQLGDQQFDTAAEWFERAANLGMTDSQFNLGMLYARGLGVDQSLENSYKWFSLAARSGDADAAKSRDDMARSLTADVVKRLNNEVAGWKAQPIDLAANFAPIGTWSTAFDPGETIKTKDVVSKVQMALAKLGYDVGTPDGLAGPKTADAIKAFEQGTGMSESGVINPRLLAVLGSQPV